MWSSRAGPRPGLTDKAVPLEAYQMGTNGVVCKPQFGGEFVDGALTLPQQSEDLAARAFDQPFTPW
jgi:hypothetical protein